MRGCRTARTRITVALDRELALEDRLWLDLHLERCSECREHERRMLRLEEWLEGPGDRPPVAPDVETAVTGVLGTLDRGEGAPWRPERRLHPVPVLVGVAAAVLLIVVALRWRSESALPPALPEVVAPAPEVSVPVEAPSLEGDDEAAEQPWTAASVERHVRAAVLTVFHDGAEGLQIERFRERTRDVARSGWPVRRLVEDLLEHPDGEVARGAARCLGALGDPGAVPALERALQRGPAADSAFDALARLGQDAVPALERSLAVPERALRALNRLCRIGGERAARAIERRVLASAAGAEPSRASLLDALVSTGRPAVAVLMRLAGATQGDERAAILDRLVLVDGAGDEIVRSLGAARPAREELYSALALLQPPAALPWLEERCGEFRERPAALATLARYSGTAPLGSLRRVWGAGRISREDAIELLKALAEHDEVRLLEDAEALVAAGDGVVLHDWTGLLIESESPHVAPSLATLAFGDALGPDDRQWAALAVGEIGRERDVAMLADLLHGRESEDRRRTAACLLAIHAHGGAEAVLRALPGVPFGEVRTLLEALEREAPAGAIRVHRVTRVLDGVLAGLANERRLEKEI
jgi:hypothetical protein